MSVHPEDAKLGCNATARIATKTDVPVSPPPSPSEDDDEGLLGAARGEAERRAAESETRRKRDLDLRNALAQEDFSGVGWDRFANELARYGIAVLVVWMRTDRIFVECARRFGGKEKKFSLPPSPLNWTDEERADLAAVVITKAITTFKQKALRGGGWTYSGGASTGSSLGNATDGIHTDSDPNLCDATIVSAGNGGPRGCSMRVSTRLVWIKR